MASYMILSALSGKGPMSPEVTTAALTALICKPYQGGAEPSLLCALAVAQVPAVYCFTNAGKHVLLAAFVEPCTRHGDIFGNVFALRFIVNGLELFV